MFNTQAQGTIIFNAVDYPKARAMFSYNVTIHLTADSTQNL